MSHLFSQMGLPVRSLGAVGDNTNSGVFGGDFFGNTNKGKKALGLDKDLGSIESGKLADLVIMDSNPLENIRNTNTVRYVVKNGRLYDGDTLDEIYPNVKKLDVSGWTKEVPGK